MLQSTGNNYHNILHAYAGYKKQRVNLKKKSRRMHNFIYKMSIRKIYGGRGGNIGIHLFMQLQKYCTSEKKNI